MGIFCGRFHEYYPLVFEGGLDPFRAEQWMAMISSILDSMGLVGHDRVACATYVLRDDARTWWEVVSQTRDTYVMDWNNLGSCSMKDITVMQPRLLR